MKNLDTLYTDATCYESAMRYPTDAKLLWECIEKVYPMMCQASRELGIHRMRTKYLDVSRDNMAYVKQRRHTKQRIRKIIRRLLDLPVKDTRSAEKARQGESLCRALL